MTQADVRAQIDRIELEMTAEWGRQGQRQLAEVQERCMRAREKQLPPPTWRERLDQFIKRAAATLMAAQR